MSIHRHLQLGLLGWEALQQKLGKQRSQSHLISRLGHLHGLPQKMAQVLSLKELQQDGALTPLTEYAGTLPFAQIEALLAAAWGCPWREVLEDLSDEGISASLGQVHQGIYQGQPVAIKVQYPDIATYLETDLQALGWIASPVGGLKKGFNLTAYQQEMRQMLLQELDYRQEAQWLETFARQRGEVPGLHTPDLITALSTPTVLVSSWLAGERFSHTHAWPEPQRQLLAERLLTLFLHSTLHWGHLHADPHQGNYRFIAAEAPEIGLIDFGCVKVLPHTVRSAFSKMVTGLQQQSCDTGQLLALFIAMGFQERYLQPMAPKLAPLARHLLAPFLQDAPFDFQAWNLGPTTTAILGDDRWNFRFAGPADLIFWMRAWQGLIQYLRALPPINAYRIWQATAPATAGPLAPGPALSSPQAWLHILLSDQGEPLIRLKYPPALIFEIEELIPDDVLAVLAERQVDLASIQALARGRELAPGELLSLTYGPRTLRLWIA